MDKLVRRKSYLIEQVVEECMKEYEIERWSEFDYVETAKIVMASLISQVDEMTDSQLDQHFRNKYREHLEEFITLYEMYKKQKRNFL